jgi:hypothetical protein
MEAKRLKEKCEMIYDFFDTPNDCLNVRPCCFTEFFEEVFNSNKEWKDIKLICETELNDAPNDIDKIRTVFYESNKIAFAFGYVVGRLLDPGDKKILLDAEEAIKKVIREKQLLLYIPRAKRAA